MDLDTVFKKITLAAVLETVYEGKGWKYGV